MLTSFKTGQSSPGNYPSDAIEMLMQLDVQCRAHNEGLIMQGSQWRAHIHIDDQVGNYYKNSRSYPACKENMSYKMMTWSHYLRSVPH